MSTFNFGGITYVSTSTTTVAVSISANATGSINIPASVSNDGTTYSVTSIGNAAFQNCSGLTSVTIPNSVTIIEDHAFNGCSGLTSVTIPNSVTSIGNYAFNVCSGLTSVTIPNSVTSIGDYAFYFCSGLTSLTIPSSVTSIGYSAFFGCSGLTSVTIPSSVTSISNYVFTGCSGLTSVTIPSSVTSIGEGAFFDCSGLTSMTIPSSVTSIGEHAFAACTGLTSIICNIITPLPISSMVFQNLNLGACSLTVPTASLAAYRVANVWKNFIPILLPQIGDYTTFTIIGGAPSGWSTPSDINMTKELNGSWTLSSQTLSAGSIRFRANNISSTIYGSTGFPSGTLAPVRSGGYIPVTAGTYDITVSASGVYSFITVTKPSVPQNMRVVANSTTKATVMFSTPAYSGSSAITGYTVSAPGLTPVIVAVGSSLQATFQSLISGASYTFSVVANNGSSSSLAASATVEMPVTPSELMYTFELTGPEGINSGAYFDYYVNSTLVETYNTWPAKSLVLLPGNTFPQAQNTPVIIQKLVNRADSIKLVFNVDQGINAAESSVKIFQGSAEVFVRTQGTFISANFHGLQYEVSGAPTNVSTFSLAGGITVTFNAPVNIGSTGIVSYRVSAKNLTNTTADIIATGSDLLIPVNGLVNNDSYKFTVIAINNKLFSSFPSEPSAEVTAVAHSVTITANKTTINSGESVTFTATPNGSSILPSYQWYIGGTLVAGQNSAIFTTSSLVNGNSVYAKLTSNGVLSTSNTVTITVNNVKNIEVNLDVNVDANGEIQILGATTLTLENVIVANTKLPTSALYRAATPAVGQTPAVPGNSMFEFWEPENDASTPNVDLTGLIYAERSNVTGDYKTLTRSLENGLHACLKGQFSAIHVVDPADSTKTTIAAPFNDAKYTANAEQYRKANSFGDLALGAITHYIMGHVAATSAISNDKSFVDAMNSSPYVKYIEGDSDNAKKLEYSDEYTAEITPTLLDAMLAKLLVKEIASKSPSDAALIARQVIGQDASRAMDQDNNKPLPNVRQPLKFIAGDIIYMNIKLQQPTVTIGTGQQVSPSTLITKFPTNTVITDKTVTNYTVKIILE